MNAHVEQGIASIDGGDAKNAWKALERFYDKEFRRGQASDEDVAAALVAFDRLLALSPNDATVARYENSLVVGLRDRVAANPDAFPSAAAIERERRDAASAIARERSVQAKAERLASTRAEAVRRLPMATTPNLPGREIAEALGVVSGSCVMSRNVLSDVGSDFKSTFGGTLEGVEKALESARRLA